MICRFEDLPCHLVGDNGPSALSPATWHDKHTYLSRLRMLGVTQLNFFADHIIFNKGYMKHAHTRQRMTNNNYNNKRKQV